MNSNEYRKVAEINEKITQEIKALSVDEFFSFFIRLRSHHDLHFTVKAFSVVIYSHYYVYSPYSI